MTTILIRNGRVIDPSCGKDAIADLFIEDGQIVGTPSLSPSTIIDAAGLWVVPGLIDVHVHLREPGAEHKETIETGTAAAAAGGFTTVIAMPNTTPCADNPDVLKMVMEKAASLGGTRVIQSCAITVGRRGEQVVDMAAIKKETGVFVFTDDGDGVESDAVMEDALCRAVPLCAILSQHSEFARISKKAALHEGEVSAVLKLAGQPVASEYEMVARDIALVKKTGGRLHVSHISSAEAIDAVRRAREEGLPVTAEVTPHHLHLTDDTVGEAGTMAKVAPPLRPLHHVEACRAALADGTIDVIATDHAPHTIADKAGSMEKASFGMVGLEIAVPMILALVKDNVLTPSRMIDAMSCAPARIFGIPGGTLAPGAAADITLIDPDDPFDIDPRTFRSKGINTPFAGYHATGRAVCTIVGGRIIYRTGRAAQTPGS